MKNYMFLLFLFSLVSISNSCYAVDESTWYPINKSFTSEDVVVQYYKGQIYTFSKTGNSKPELFTGFGEHPTIEQFGNLVDQCIYGEGPIPDGLGGDSKNLANLIKSSENAINTLNKASGVNVKNLIGKMKVEEFNKLIEGKKQKELEELYYEQFLKIGFIGTKWDQNGTNYTDKDLRKIADYYAKSAIHKSDKQEHAKITGNIELRIRAMKNFGSSCLT